MLNEILNFLNVRNAVHVGLWLSLVALVYSVVVGSIQALFTFTVLQYRAIRIKEMMENEKNDLN